MPPIFIIRTPFLIGNAVLVKDQYGQTISMYNALSLAIEWLNTTEESFYQKHGFDWTPPSYLRGQAYRASR